MTVHLGVPSVRPAEQRDVPRIAATLTLVQATSRWARWALPDDGRVQRLTRLAELDAGHRAVSTGTAWVTEDVTAAPPRRPALVAAPPGHPPQQPAPRLRDGAARAGARAVRRRRPARRRRRRDLGRGPLPAAARLRGRPGDGQLGRHPAALAAGARTAGLTAPRGCH